jgi:hypothetical protein
MAGSVYARYNFVYKIPHVCAITASLPWFSPPKTIRLRYAFGVPIIEISF